MRIWCGIDAGWATSHATIVNRHGVVLASFPLTTDRCGLADLVSRLRAWSGGRRREVTIAIEDTGLLLAAALADQGYDVRHVLPRASARYRQAHLTSGAKSDVTDSFLLAEMIRTEPLTHRRRPVFSDDLLALRTLERAHQDALWSRQAKTNQLRALLTAYYPAASQTFRVLHSPYALTTLQLAPSPEAALRLRRPTLRKALAELPVRRDADRASEEILAALRQAELRRAPAVEAAMSEHAIQLLHELAVATTAIDALADSAITAFRNHPLALIYRSFPALQGITAARLLGEIGDDPGRFRHPHGLQALAGTLPVTQQSGTAKVVYRRLFYNRRLGHAAHMWATPLITTSPAARARYEHRRAAGDRYGAAARNVVNHYLGILYQCLQSGTLYREPSVGDALDETPPQTGSVRVAGGEHRDHRLGDDLPIGRGGPVLDTQTPTTARSGRETAVCMHQSIMFHAPPGHAGLHE